jgi:hypothetical protein
MDDAHTSVASCSDDTEQTQKKRDDLTLDMDLLNKMMEKCQLGPQKPWPEFVHQHPKAKQGDILLVATLDACPLPIGSRLIPAPFHKANLSKKSFKDMLINNAFAIASSHPLFGVFPIVLPVIPPMLTGVHSTFITHGMKQQLLRYEEIFKKLQEEAPDKEEFLSSERARKLRYEHQNLSRSIRTQLREERSYVVDAWEPIQSTMSIFTFYSKVIDVFRQYHGFVSTANTLEYERYTRLLTQADGALLNENQKLLENFPEEFDDFNRVIQVLKRENGFLNNPFILLDNIKQEFPPDVPFEQRCVNLITYFTISVLKNMERWILTVCDIVPECHRVLFLDTQPLPVPSDVNPTLIKLMKEQYTWIQNIRRDAYCVTWQNGTIKPVLLSPGTINSSVDHRLFYLESLRAVSRVKTSYDSTIKDAQRRASILKRSCPRHEITARSSIVMKWYPDPPSRFQPLDIFSKNTTDDTTLRPASSLTYSVFDLPNNTKPILIGDDLD